MKIHKFSSLLITGLSLIGLLYILNHPLGPLPSLLPVINPISGVWVSQGRGTKLPKEIEGLLEPAEVIFDEHSVPHIFAKTFHDLFLIQGYIEAQHRLFQMDLQTRAGAGQLSELLGPKTLKRDEFFVKIGFRQAVETKLNAVMSDSQSWLALEAYSRGVNTYIKSLSPEDLPPEYKILGAKPSEWSPLRTVQLLAAMSFRLSGRSYDLVLTEFKKKFGKERIDFLFPDDSSGKAPFATTYGLKDVLKRQTPLEEFESQIKEFPHYLRPFTSQGSNNWAVAPEKSETGQVLLANDTHLAYSLPAQWYEVQLYSPGVNVYGASFPGSPGVMIGFNSDIAWGVTNGTTDVTDWFEIEFKDETSREYLYEGEWHEARAYEELIQVKGSKSKSLEILWTLHGPVVHREGKIGLALNWTLYLESPEFATFLRLNKAQSFEECEQAVQTFVNPGQNFICTDSKNIGIFHTGKYPLRYKGQGRYVLDGRKQSDAWNRWIPAKHNPSSKNPKTNFVQSANQRPFNSSYPYYLGWDYPESFRAQSILEFLKGKNKLSVQDMKDLQTSAKDQLAIEALPKLIEVLETAELPQNQEMLLNILKRWDGKSQDDLVAPSLFFGWWHQLERALFEDQLIDSKLYVFPKRHRTLELLSDSSPEATYWVDDIKTAESETLQVIALRAWMEALDELKSKAGPNPDNWQWAHIQPANLPHIAKFPGFGEVVSSAGSKDAPNANRGVTGAVWRMVVAHGNPIQAWVNYPGGQTGHPFEVKYTEFLNQWSKGEYRKVRFLKDLEEQKPNDVRHLIKPVKGRAL